jgi:CheY-like chemotaxis protein
LPFSVLTVDDDATTHQVLSVLIEIEDGLEPTAPAFDGRQALLRVQDKCPDVIICDVNMPGMSGIQVLPLLRDACPEAVIALYSSHPAARTGTALGANAVFDKSADDPSEMLSELLRLCETSRRSDER